VSDGHCNDEGYRVIADLVCRHLLREIGGSTQAAGNPADPDH
jgi:hypothetical protein